MTTLHRGEILSQSRWRKSNLDFNLHFSMIDFCTKRNTVCCAKSIGNSVIINRIWFDFNKIQVKFLCVLEPCRDCLTIFPPPSSGISNASTQKISYETYQGRLWSPRYSVCLTNIKNCLCLQASITIWFWYIFFLSIFFYFDFPPSPFWWHERRIRCCGATSMIQHVFYSILFFVRFRKEISVCRKAHHVNQIIIATFEFM